MTSPHHNCLALESSTLLGLSLLEFCERLVGATIKWLSRGGANHKMATLWSGQGQSHKRQFQVMCLTMEIGRERVCVGGRQKPLLLLHSAHSCAEQLRGFSCFASQSAGSNLNLYHSQFFEFYPKSQGRSRS